MKLLKRLSLAVVIVAVGISAACQFLPEKYAVSVPLMSMVFGVGGGTPSEGVFTDRLRAPDGWSVSIYGEVPNARLLRFTSSGDLLVSSPRQGSIYRLERDADSDGAADSVAKLRLDLDRPHGLDVFEGHLYIGEASEVRRVAYNVETAEVSGELTILVPDLPEGGNHWTRTIAIGPDRKLYVAVGSSCNVCVEADDRRAAMLRYELDGSGYELYATGLRNAVDFDWHPANGKLFATDNGRDLLGNDFPPCELNEIEAGGFYGWPYVNGDGVSDPDFGGQRPDLEARAISPVHGFRAHNAPLGIGFASGPLVPAGYENAAFVALHGSWNRTVKDGYRVVSLHWTGQGIERRDFLTGFELDDSVIGRPVDAELGPDGAIYVSDDFAGVVWRVSPPDIQAGAAPYAPVAPTPDSASDLGKLSSSDLLQLEALGKSLYESNACASCHEASHAETGVVARKLENLSERYSIESLSDFFTAPTPPMPVFVLDATQRRALAVHLLAEDTAQ